MSDGTVRSSTSVATALRVLEERTGWRGLQVRPRPFPGVRAGAAPGSGDLPEGETPVSQNCLGALQRVGEEGGSRLLGSCRAIALPRPPQPVPRKAFLSEK